jgi:hypothetical protein
VAQDRTNGAMIALQLTMGGEYDDDGITAPSHPDSSLSRSLAAMLRGAS